MRAITRALSTPDASAIASLCPQLDASTTALITRAREALADGGPITPADWRRWLGSRKGGFRATAARKATGRKSLSGNSFDRSAEMDADWRAQMDADADADARERDRERAAAAAGLCGFCGGALGTDGLCDIERRTRAEDARRERQARAAMLAADHAAALRMDAAYDAAVAANAAVAAVDAFHVTALAYARAHGFRAARERLDTLRAAALQALAVAGEAGRAANAR